MLVSQTYVYGPDELRLLPDSVTHLGISFEAKYEDFNTKVYNQIESVEFTRNFKNSKVFAFTPNLKRVLIAGGQIDCFDWEDLPSKVTSLQLGNVPRNMENFKSSLPTNLKTLHLGGKWKTEQITSLLSSNNNLEILTIEGARLKDFILESSTLRYLGLVKLNLSKITFKDVNSLSTLFIDECKLLDMNMVDEMLKLQEIVIQSTKFNQLVQIEKLPQLEELTIRNSMAKSKHVVISSNSLLKLILTNIHPTSIAVNAPALRQIDVSENGQITLSGLKSISNQLTHFYAYETTLKNVSLVEYSFQSLGFFGGLENINRKTLPKDFIEYSCSTCTGTLRRVPNDW